MSRFIQPLERRTLLTATATSLAAESAAVATAAPPVQADLLALQLAAKTDLAAITLDLKGSPKTNAPLLRFLKRDTNQFVNKEKSDVTALLRATPKTAKGAADGSALLIAPTVPALQAKIPNDIAPLTLTNTRFATLTADSLTTTVDTDLTNLTTANPTNTALTTDANKLNTDLTSLTATLLTDAAAYNSAVTTFKNDLSTLLPQPTTSPSLVGDYQGTLKTNGIIFGIGAQTYDLEINVISQTTDAITGTITLDRHSFSGTIPSTELTNGKVSFQTTQSGITLTLNGKINVTTTTKGLPPGSTINGTGTIDINGFDVNGNFSLTKVT